MRAKRDFDSLHDCFTRELKPGARTVECRPRRAGQPLRRHRRRLRRDCTASSCSRPRASRTAWPTCSGDAELVERYRDGCYVTLRLTPACTTASTPRRLRRAQVTYISGDTWNVNPIALKRVERLFCRNERALIETTLTPGGQRIVLVPVAAILVASIRLHFLDVLLHLRYRGPNEIPCAAHLAKGQEMGWFQHGSTIIVFAPKGFALCEGIADGKQARMGEALMRLPRG